MKQQPLPTKNPVLYWGSIIALALLSIASTHAATLTLQSGVNGYTTYSDVSIRSDNPNTTYNYPDNTGNGVYLGSTGTGATIRGLLNYNLSSLAGATINSVTLTLYTQKVDNGSNPFAYQIDLVRENTAFADSSATWNNSSTGTPWTTAGGDIGSTLTSLNLDPRAVVVNTAYTFATSTSFVSYVQSAVNGSGSLNMALKLDNEATGGTREIYFFYDNNGVAYAPMLTIDYTPIPEPGVLAMFLCGVGGIMLSSRRRSSVS